MNKVKFYCDCCGEVSDMLEEKYGIYCCTYCGHELFESSEELYEYINMPEPLHITPFEKSRTMEK